MEKTKTAPEEKVASPEPTVTVPAVLISFDRWFTLSGRPKHHKAGLAAFIGTQGKCTLEAWNKKFDKY